MILYKYMSEIGADKILRTNSIGFSKPDTFNDPYELQAAYPPQGDNPIALLLSRVQGIGARFTWSDTSGVLCLTRNPLNALMWAHYGCEHKGVVLGFDVEKAGFLDTQRCLIPAQFGNIVYTHTRPTHPLVPFNGSDPIHMGHTHHYPAGHEEKLHRTFLQKPACWSYEEEVRVVKCLSDRVGGTNPSGTFTEVPGNGKTLYCYKMPEGAIVEAYWGMRHSALESGEAMEKALNEYRELCPDIKVRACTLSNATWEIESVDVAAAVKKHAENSGGKGIRLKFLKKDGGVV